MKFILSFYFILFSLTAFSQFNGTKFITSSFLYDVEDMAHGDLDNDGLVDLLLISDTYNQVTWSKNIDGDGKWSTLQLIDNEYNNLQQIQASDVNADGLLDIIVASGHAVPPLYNAIVWYKNKGAGEFTESVLIGSIDDPMSNGVDFSIDIGDVDNDGDLDVVAGYDDIDKIFLFKHLDGDGNFSDPILLSDNYDSPMDIHLVNLDSDNFLDIVIQSKGIFISYFKNSNGVTFDDPITIASPNLGLKRMAFGDLDGDSDKDIVAVLGTSLQVVWYENINNEGLFSIHNVIAGNEVFRDVEISDIDGDSDNDVIFIIGYDGGTGYIKNLDGNAQFDEPTYLSPNLPNAIGSRVQCFDYDNDGNTDIIGSSREKIYLFDEPLLLPEGKDLRLVFKIENVNYGDLNGDGFPDAVVSTENIYTGTLFWQKFNPGCGLFEMPRIISQGHEVADFNFDDLNGDGINDIIFVTKTAADTAILGWQINDGQGNFSSINSLPFENGDPISIYVEDVDNDGLKDVLVRRSASSGFYFYKKENNFPSFQSSQVIYEEAHFNRDLHIFDVNLDGLKDIVFTEMDVLQVSWLKNNNGAFGSKQSLFPVTPNAPFKFVHFDFNEDGFQDIILYTTTVGEVYFYLSNQSNTYIEQQTIYSYSGLFSYLFLIDYDLDGHQDLIYISDGEINWHRYNPDMEIFDEKQPLDVGGSIMYKIDMNNDGDLDLVFGDTYEQYYTSSLLNNAQIIAKAFFDSNNNNQFDLDEAGLYGVPFSLFPDPLYLLTNQDGEKRFYVAPGEYTIQAGLLPGWSLSTDSSTYTITLDDFTLANKKFGYFPDSLFSKVIPDLTSAPTRCNFEVSFWLSISNWGTIVEKGLLELNIIQLADFVSAEPAPDSIVNNSCYWYINDLNPTYQNKVKLLFEIAGVQSIGDSVLLVANYFTEYQPGEYELSGSYSFASEINCAVDPNDKQVYPPGIHDSHYTLFDSELIYTIRFQNTGTDTAFNITIIDELDNDLDWSTFRVITSSHYMETSIDPNTGVVTFYFPDILLPDSIVNEVLSHGFVKYLIKAMEGIPENTPVRNRADIYFDFNDPVSTNATLNTMVSEIPETDAVVKFETLKENIYPNPFDDYFIIEFPENFSPNDLEINVYNVLGQKLESNILYEGQAAFVFPENAQNGLITCEIIYKGKSFAALVVHSKL